MTVAIDQKHRCKGTPDLEAAFSSWRNLTRQYWFSTTIVWWAYCCLKPSLCVVGSVNFALFTNFVLFIYFRRLPISGRPVSKFSKASDRKFRHTRIWIDLKLVEFICNFSWWSLMITEDNLGGWPNRVQLFQNFQIETKNIDKFSQRISNTIHHCCRNFLLYCFKSKNFIQNRATRQHKTGHVIHSVTEHII